jgi:hypothetical protein
MRDSGIAHPDLVICMSRRFGAKPRTLLRTPL